MRSKGRDWINSRISGSDRSTWFGLFKDDEYIDDKTFIDNVERGKFRLHPSGYAGTSNGCITLLRHSDFAILRDALLRANVQPITSDLNAYGTIQVY